MKWTITEMAESYNITTETLRKWERDFSLKIPRNDENHRYYRQEEKEILDYIVDLKKQGLTKKAIIKALDMSASVADQREEASQMVPIEYMTGADITKLLKEASERHQVALADNFKRMMVEALQDQEERHRAHVETLQDEYNRRLEEVEEKQLKVLNELVEGQKKMIEEMEKKEQGFFNRIFKRSPS